MNLPNMGLKQGIRRTPDAMLYALAQFIYSLQPPPNPNPMNDAAKRGSQLF